MINFFRRLFPHGSQDRRDERHNRQHGFVVALIERDTNLVLPDRLVAPKR